MIDVRGPLLPTRKKHYLTSLSSKPVENLETVGVVVVLHSTLRPSVLKSEIFSSYPEY